MPTIEALTIKKLDDGSYEFSARYDYMEYYGKSFLKNLAFIENLQRYFDTEPFTCEFFRDQISLTLKVPFSDKIELIMLTKVPVSEARLIQIAALRKEAIKKKYVFRAIVAVHILALAVMILNNLEIVQPKIIYRDIPCPECNPICVYDEKPCPTCEICPPEKVCPECKPTFVYDERPCPTCEICPPEKVCPECKPTFVYDERPCPKCPACKRCEKCPPEKECPEKECPKCPLMQLVMFLFRIMYVILKTFLDGFAICSTWVHGGGVCIISWGLFYTSIAIAAFLGVVYWVIDWEQPLAHENSHKKRW